VRVPTRDEIASHVTWALKWFLIDDHLDELIIDELLHRLGARRSHPEWWHMRSPLALIVTKLKAEELGAKATW
jgi:hypothetical protein